MRIFIYSAILFTFTSAKGSEAVLPDISGSQYKWITVTNNQGSGEVYIENYRHTKTLLYKADFPYSKLSVFSVDEMEKKDILMIDFECGKKEKKTICTRFFDRHTNQMSAIYPNILGFNSKKNVVAYYVDDKNLVVIAPVFDTCKKLLTYYLKIFPDSIFGVKTQFFKNGDLQLDYAEAKKGEDAFKTIHVDYRRLFDNCAM
jgi:hypothetical protein